MKYLLILAPLAIAACVPLPQQCGPTEAVVISYTKTGLAIYDDQSPILPPCEASTHNPPKTPLPPVSGPPMTPEPPFMPPIEKVKGKHPNSGRGNGSELDGNGFDVDPGNSGGHNNGDD